MDFSGLSQAAGVYLEEVVVERCKLVIYILLNSGEKQVIANTFELFDVDCMYLQAEKVVGALGGLLALFFFWKGFVTVLLSGS